MTIQLDPAAGRTNSFMTATGKLVKCVEVLSTSEKMRDQLEDLIYDVIVTAEYGAFVAGFSAGQDYPGCKVEGVTAMTNQTAKLIEERISLALMELLPIVDENNPLEDYADIYCNVDAAIGRLEPVLAYFRALNKQEVN